MPNKQGNISLFMCRKATESTQAKLDTSCTVEIPPMMNGHWSSGLSDCLYYRWSYPTPGSIPSGIRNKFSVEKGRNETEKKK